jgi:hypothetical protein
MMHGSVNECRGCYMKGYLRDSTYHEYKGALNAARLIRERFGRKARVTKQKLAGKKVYVVWEKIEL